MQTDAAFAARSISAFVSDRAAWKARGGKGGGERKSLAGEVTLRFERGCADNSHTIHTPRRFTGWQGRRSYYGRRPLNGGGGCVCCSRRRQSARSHAPLSRDGATRAHPLPPAQSAQHTHLGGCFTTFTTYDWAVYFCFWAWVPGTGGMDKTERFHFWENGGRQKYWYRGSTDPPPPTVS